MRRGLPAMLRAALCVALVGLVVLGGCTPCVAAGMEARDSTTGNPASLRSHGYALDVFHAFAAAGERLLGSLTGTDYSSVSGEWKSITQASNATGDVVVYPGPAIVRMIRVRYANDAGTATSNTVGIILVKDGSTVKEGAPAAKTPGATIFDGLDGTVFRTSVVLNFASSSDNPASNGKIEILLRPTCSGEGCPNW